MKIETLVNVLEGELLNRPFISKITSFALKTTDVTRGSLYIAFDEKSCQKAIENGAYAIVSEKYLSVTDQEIAWIKVDDIKTSLIKLLKFHSLNKTLFFSDPITLQIIKKINRDEKLKILDEDFLSQIIEILNAEEVYMITANKSLKSEFHNVKKLKKSLLKVEKHDLFSMSVVIDSSIKEIKLPFVYLESFSKAVKFFEKYALVYSLEDTQIERFTVDFVNKNLEKVEFGSSDQVVISHIKQDEYFIHELNYIIEHTKHAKTLFFNEENIRDLNQIPFNFAVLIDVTGLLKEKESKETNLF